MDFFTLGANIRSSEQLILGVMLFFGFVAYIREWRWTWLIAAAVAIRIAIPVALSWIQWKTWSAPGHGLTQLFLPPHQPISYFLHYAWTNFGYRHALALLFGAAIGVCAWALTKYREGAMLPEEVGMLTLSALVLGWPVGLLLPFMTVLVSTLALIVMKIFDTKAKMTLGLWSLTSTIALLMWGEALIRLLHLQVLFIGR